jgi:hypothetical protein
LLIYSCSHCHEDKVAEKAVKIQFQQAQNWRQTYGDAVRSLPVLPHSPALTPQPPLPILSEGEPNSSSPSPKALEKGLRD